MKRNRNQTTATLPAAAKTAAESKPAKKLKPAPPKEKRKYKRSTPEQQQAVRAAARGMIVKYGLEVCAAGDQQYLQHTKQQMCN